MYVTHIAARLESHIARAMKLVTSRHMRESCHTYVDDVTARLHAGLLLILMCVGSDGIDTQ